MPAAAAPPKIKMMSMMRSFIDSFGDPRELLLSQYYELGPIYKLRILHIDYVVMAGQHANDFVNNEGREYFQSRTFWSGMLKELDAPNFLIALDGEDHALLRKMFKQEFSKGAIEPHYEAIYQLSIDMFKDLKPGQSVEVVERMLQLTSQMVGCVMTGKVPSRSELTEFLYYVNETTNHFTLKRLPPWLLNFRGRRFKEAKKLTQTFAQSVMDEQLSGQKHLHNFADAVVDAAHKCPHLFTAGDVRFSAILPLFAGIDTLGQTLNYALYELHRHPAILAEVRAEVDQAFAQGVPTPEVLKSMERLNSAIMETLRLHPSAFGMVRTANRDFEFEGCKVKKGQDVVILTTATHMMEENFPSPQRFDIDRYSAPRNEHRKRSVYAPFGRGPHTCLGAGMSDVMMALALGSILYQYEFDVIDPTLKFKERIGPTPSLGRAFKLKLKAVRH